MKAKLNILLSYKLNQSNKMSEKAKDFYNNFKGSDQELNDDGSVKGLFEIMQAYADQETSEIEYECEILERRAILEEASKEAAHKAKIEAFERIAELSEQLQRLEKQKAMQSALYTEHIKKYQEPS